MSWWKCFSHKNIKEFPAFGNMKYLKYWLGELENEYFQRK